MTPKNPNIPISELQQKFDALPKRYQINNFDYNGFSGQLTGGVAPYTATFTQWSTDPGIAVMACSDGKERRIPGWAIIDFNHKEMLALQDNMEAKKVVEKYGAHFGQPSSSS